MLKFNLKQLLHAQSPTSGSILFELAKVVDIKMISKNTSLWLFQWCCCIFYQVCIGVRVCGALFGMKLSQYTDLTQKLSVGIISKSTTVQKRKWIMGWIRHWSPVLIAIKFLSVIPYTNPSDHEEHCRA